MLAHISNNLMNDLFDTDVGQDTESYPRAQYAPHPILSGMATRRQLAMMSLLVNVIDLAIMLVLVAYRGPWVIAFAVGGFLLSAAYTAPPAAAEEARARRDRRLRDVGAVDGGRHVLLGDRAPALAGMGGQSCPMRCCAPPC